MTRSFRALAALSLAGGLLMPLAAQAGDGTAPAATNKANRFPYAVLQMGVGFPNTLNGNLEEGGTSIDTSLDGNTGFNGETGLGYKFGDFRSDLTFGYGNYGGLRETLRVQGLGSASKGVTGNLQMYTAMLNGYYDFPLRDKQGNLSRWSPYLGAGIGYGSLSIPDCSFSRDCYKGGSMGGFAYQGKAGLSYRAAERGYAFLEGAYLGMTGSRLNSVDYDNFGAWRINLGWRQGFGAAPAVAAVVDTPAVEPAPAPVVTPEPTPAPVVTPAPAPIRGLW